MKSHIVGKNLILPCKIIVSEMLRQNAVQEIQTVTLSDNTICHRIDDMAHDSEDVFCNKLKNSIFYIQADKSTDLNNKCHVVALARFVNHSKIQVCLVHVLIRIMHSAFNLLIFPNSMFTLLLFLFLLKGQCALWRNST